MMFLLGLLAGFRDEEADMLCCFVELVGGSSDMIDMGPHEGPVTREDNEKAIPVCRMYTETSQAFRPPAKNGERHIDASHSRQPLVKGERLVRYEVNAVMTTLAFLGFHATEILHTPPS